MLIRPKKQKMEARVPRNALIYPKQLRQQRQGDSYTGLAKAGSRERAQKERPPNLENIPTHKCTSTLYLRPRHCPRFVCVRSTHVIQKLNFKHMRKHPFTVTSEAPREANRATVLLGSSEGCWLSSPRKCGTESYSSQGKTLLKHTKLLWLTWEGERASIINRNCHRHWGPPPCTTQTTWKDPVFEEKAGVCEEGSNRLERVFPKESHHIFFLKKRTSRRTRTRRRKKSGGRKNPNLSWMFFHHWN